MEFRMLGPLEARDRDRPVSLGGGKRRALLGVLLLHPNEVVSTQRLIDELWGPRPPAAAAKLVQGYVSGLRKRLGPARLVTQQPGYLVRLDADELDLLEFERLSEEAREEQEPRRAAELLREALALWRGPALADLHLEGHAAREAERLNDLRLVALLERIDADLALGRHAELVGELEALVAEHPLQERPRGQLMIALYRSGRQAEALEVYRTMRRLLAEELGLEPSEGLERLERLVLTHDPELTLPRAEPSVEPSPPPPTPPPKRLKPVRRTVSVVFADLAGSTDLGERLDPEKLHRVLARYSETCAEVLERHGGTVEKFVGDAVVAFFGLPNLHEDDALRAVRAAVELRDAVVHLSEELKRESGLRIAVKLAVNSGEVFIGPGSRRQTFASGDAVNVAARLEHSAKKGEILLGEQTQRLVEHAVRAEALEPLNVKGRKAAVRAWRLLELRREEPGLLQPPKAPFVGRSSELSSLEQELQRAISERACRLCTVVGAPGIGKSRLIREFVVELGQLATVAVGRCLFYGEGVTYRPLAEIVRGLCGGEPRELIGELVQANEHKDLVAERVLGAIGLAEPGGREETFWAVRQLFETAAPERPLIAVFEDLHWAEPTLLDLLEYVASFSSGAPILLTGLARPELLETHPGWAAPQPNRTVLALEPLPLTEAQELVALLGDGQLDEQGRARIVETAEGNPLFLEQLVAVQAEGEELPPSVRAVLAARVDRLDPGEGAVLERASVEGRTFHRGAVAHLLPTGQRSDLESHLLALVRKQLIRPNPPEFHGEDGFRFTHILIRDAAYAAIPKELRGELHESLADWLEAKPNSQDEIVGYHLEQAYRYRAELDRLDDRDRKLAARAMALLEAAGRRALSRSDLPAAINLLERAATLLPQSDPARAALLPVLGATLMEAGRLPDAERVLAEARQEAAALGDEGLSAHALVEHALLQLQMTSDATAEATAAVERALPVFARNRDELGTCRARRLEAWVHWIHGRTAAAEASWNEAAKHASRAGAEREEAEVLLWLADAALFGPIHAEAGVARCEEFLPRMSGRRLEKALLLYPLAALNAMLGRFGEAHRLLAEAKAALADFGVTLSANSHAEALVAMLAGDSPEAERCLRADYDTLGRMGEKGFLSTTAALLARAVDAQGRHEEAHELTEIAERTGASDDLATQIVWRGVRAGILAERGLAEKAERLAREAVALAEQTDRLNYHGDALVDLARVLRKSRDAHGELEALEAAHTLYERKGNLVGSSRARERLGEVSRA